MHVCRDRVGDGLHHGRRTIARCRCVRAGPAAEPIGQRVSERGLEIHRIDSSRVCDGPIDGQASDPQVHLARAAG